MQFISNYFRIRMEFGRRRCAKNFTAPSKTRFLLNKTCLSKADLKELLLPAFAIDSAFKFSPSTWLLSTSAITQ